MAKKTKPAPKAQAAPKVQAAAATTQSLIPVLKGTALSTDVGPKVCAMLADSFRFDQEAEKLRLSGKAKEYDSLMLVTEGIVKAVKADSSINLAAVFEEAKSPAKAKLNNQLYMAMGFKVPSELVKGKQRMVWSETVAPFVEPDGPTDPVATQKGTVRTNLAHMLTKCIHNAIYVVENKVDIKRDKASGTLLLTGPTIKQHFGEASVLLNEKQTVQLRDKKGNVTGEKTLKHKPSYAEIARLGAEAHGKVLAKRVDSRATAPKDVDAHIEQVCASLVKALEKMTKPSDKAKAALESVRNAIDELLD